MIRLLGRSAVVALVVVALAGPTIASANNATAHKLSGPAQASGKASAEAVAAAHISYRIVSAKDGRCVDSDVGTPTHNGTKVQAWTCNGWDNQRWYYYTDNTIRSAEDGRCLDADVSSATHNGTKVQVWSCNGWDNQKWFVYSDGTIRSKHDGRCLDEDVATATHDGTKIQIWDCNGWPNQKWYWRSLL